MKPIYYIEVNALCMAVLFMLLLGQWDSLSKDSMVTRLYRRIIYATILLCASDMIAGITAGEQFAGAKIVIELSNLAYFEVMTVISFQWAIYIHVILGLDRIRNKWYLWCMDIPIIIITIAAVTNPITHFLFSVNENNLYSRGSGIVLHWIVTWGYLIFASMVVAHRTAIEKSRIRRSEILPYLYFVITPFAAGLLQMLVYGISATQAGITVSLVMIFVSQQKNQILTDRLTGLSNRRALDNYLERHYRTDPEKPMMLMMIDINHFKSVNDTYGHLTGDRLLACTSEYLGKICMEFSRDLFLCRFGGDEFVIVARAENKDGPQRLKNEILGRMTEIVAKENIPWDPSLSVGFTVGICTDDKSCANLLHEADMVMYEEKKQLQVKR